MSYSSHVKSVPATNINQLSLVDQKGKYSRLTSDKCGSLLFTRFMMGLKNQMGNIWKPSKGLSRKLLMLVSERAEQSVKVAENSGEEHIWTVFASYLVLTYVVALRGNDGFMLELRGLRSQLRVIRRLLHDSVVWKIERRRLIP